MIEKMTLLQTMCLDLAKYALKNVKPKPDYMYVNELAESIKRTIEDRISVLVDPEEQ